MAQSEYAVCKCCHIDGDLHMDATHEICDIEINALRKRRETFKLKLMKKTKLQKKGKKKNI